MLFTVTLLHTVWLSEILLTKSLKIDLTPARTVQNANYIYGIYILHPKHTVDQYKINKTFTVFLFTGIEGKDQYHHMHHSQRGQ